MRDLIYKTNGGELYTTSPLVAEKFKKRHKNVIQKIQNLDEVIISRLKIQPSEFTDSRGKSQIMYLINRDAFAFIAMGFTGRQADKWKLDYIEAFNKMERIIKRQLKREANLEWKKARKEAAIESRLMCKTLNEVRKLQSKKTKFFHYANEHKLVNFAITGFYKGIKRNELSEDQLSVLTRLEIKNAVLLGAGLGRGARKAALIDLYQQISGEINFPSVIA